LGKDFGKLHQLLKELFFLKMNSSLIGLLRKILREDIDMSVETLHKLIKN
jgi:hypothetical protein